MSAAVLQVLHMLLALALAPALTGVVRVTKALLVGGGPPSVWQPYGDLARLLRDEAVVAENASWLFLAVPYLVFSLIWLAASLVPSFTLALWLGPASDLVSLVALLGAARFFIALAGMDAGAGFGRIGAGREMTIATLAAPATFMVILTLSLWAGSTSLSHIAGAVLAGERGAHLSAAMALAAMVMVSMAVNARIPLDAPATPGEPAMAPDTKAPEYSARYLALIDAAAMLKLLVYLSLILCLFAPWGMAPAGAGPLDIASAMSAYVLKLFAGGVALGVFEVATARMRDFRAAEFLGGALLIAVLAAVFLLAARAL
jgi:formate hydrogenlyase subunit 4